MEKGRSTPTPSVTDTIHEPSGGFGEPDGNAVDIKSKYVYHLFFSFVRLLSD